MGIHMVANLGELVPLHPEKLSAKEFVIYQYGILLLQSLRPHIGVRVLKAAKNFK